VTERRRHLEAQVRQLRRELPRHPWLHARLADLMLAAGRSREAAALLRKGTADLAGYSSAQLVAAELAAQGGEERRAEELREQVCRSAPGIHAGWTQRLAAAREDSLRYLELLQQVWELDQFSPRLNLELEQAGLRRVPEYEQALRPTATEAARREAMFRRLLDDHERRQGQSAEGSALDPEAESAEASAEPVVPVAATAAGAEVPVEAASSETVAGEEGESPADEDDGEDLEQGEPPPVPAGRERALQEQAERLESLGRPLTLPRGLPDDPGRRVGARAGDLFDPRSMMTRRLIRLYLEQGYPTQAAAALKALLAREAAAPDLAALQEEVREAERRQAEQPAPGRRRRG
jgi:hypothetical protein